MKSKIEVSSFWLFIWSYVTAAAALQASNIGFAGSGLIKLVGYG